MSTKPAQECDHQCQQVTSDGRRCRMSRMKGHPSLCFVHAQRQQHILDPQRVATELLGPFQDLKTTNAVNHALGSLFLMVAQNRIPPRNAAILAYIGQLLLQSLRPVESEIKDAWGYRCWDQALRQVLLDASQTQAPGRLTQATIEASLPPQEEEEEDPGAQQQADEAQGNEGEQEDALASA